MPWTPCRAEASPHGPAAARVAGAISAGAISSLVGFLFFPFSFSVFSGFLEGTPKIAAGHIEKGSRVRLQPKYDTIQSCVFCEVPEETKMTTVARMTGAGDDPVSKDAPVKA